MPWNTALAVRHTTNLITINEGPDGSPCPNGARPLAPELEAGVADPTAATHSPFTLVLKRSDGEQDLTGLTVNDAARVRRQPHGIPYCPESAISTLSEPDTGPHRAGGSRLSGEQPGRHRGHRRRRRHPPALHPRQGLPRRSI